MRLFHKIFLAHPKEVNETYAEHFKEAGCCGFKMFVAGIACMIHAVIPCIFVTTASQCIQYLKEQFVDRKRL